ncbi:hypothetical protein P3G55_25920, partial [Leptospira sp. 96542]|nr:hypothetical protein [Leptospira sp. 96542]
MGGLPAARPANSVCGTEAVTRKAVGSYTTSKGRPGIRNILSNALKFIPNETNIEIRMIEREFIPRKSKKYIPGIGLQ